MPKKKDQKNTVKRYPFFFSIETGKLKFEEGKAPEEIQVLMCGKWNHPFYGPIIIEPQDIAQFKMNFDAGVRRDIPITEGHETMDEKPAIGWFKELIDKGTEGLWAVMEWTEKGKTLLSDKAYKYFSPEFYTEYEDPETREIYEDVLVGGALTNKPYFKKMKAVVLSEKMLNNNYLIFSDMDLQAILAKKVEELSAEEIAFLKENKEGLTAEQLATFGSVLEEKEEKGKEGEGKEGEGKEEEGKEGEGKEGEGKEEEGKDGEGKGGEGEGEGEGGEPNKASEKAGMVQISAAELSALRNMANKGAKAFDEMRKEGIKNEAKALVFSEQNSNGRIMPKHETKVFSFMLGLTEAQRKEFAEIVKEIPASKLFGETGSNRVAEGSAAAEVEAKCKKLMSENKGMTYADAVRRLMSEDKALAERYESEMAN